MPTPGTMQAEYELMKQMSKAVQRAVLDAKEKNPDLYDMATTGVMARTVRMKDGRWEVVGSRVGDSRIYVQYPDGRLESLTLDAHPLLDMIKGKYGREAAIRVQDTLDDLESFRQFENFSKFSREDKWPPKMPIDRQDIDFVSGLVNPELVKIYFEGVDRTPNATQEQRMEEFQKSMFHRSVVTGAYGLTPHADFFHGFLPAGGKLVLTSDGVEGLKRKEMAGLLMNNPDLIHPKIWQQAELADTPAERLAFAANAVASNYVWSPRNKGHDDITVVVAEIPER
jgi:serine/threonine protein phosphatase PrpC